MRSSELPDARAPGRCCHPLSKSAPARGTKRIGQPVTEPRKEPQVPNPSPRQQTTKLRIYSEALGDRSSLSISEGCSQEQRGSGDPKILALSSKVVLQRLIYVLECQQKRPAQALAVLTFLQYSLQVLITYCPL